MFIGNVWVVPGRVLLLLYSQRLTLADVQQSVQQMIVCAKAEGTAPVHVIGDVTGRTGVDTSLLNLRALGPLNRLVRHDPHFGWFLLVDPAPNPFGVGLLNVVSLAGRTSFRAFTHGPCALAFLHSVDASLPPDMALEGLQPTCQPLASS